MENQDGKQLGQRNGQCGYGGFTCLWVAGNAGMEKNIVTTITGYLGSTVRIHVLLGPCWSLYP